MTHASIMDELDTRAAASEPARMRGVADGRLCIGERGRELHIERAGMWSMCGRARPAQPRRELEKQGCMCDEFVRSQRWLSSSQGFVPILATCTSFKKWVRAVQFHAASARARGRPREVSHFVSGSDRNVSQSSAQSVHAWRCPLSARKIAGGGVGRVCVNPYDK